MRILAIESSCDETAAAVVEDGRRTLSSVVASQAGIHAAYGGVVPEVASRAHIEAVSGVTASALAEAGVDMGRIDVIGVTFAPGLIGALLVGVGFAKGLAFAYDKPLVGVHHIRGHVAANYLCEAAPEPPFLAFVASGGHTSILQVNGYTDFITIGRTRDDAAGEAFDKIGRVMGLSYPAGREIDVLASRGDPSRYAFPHSRVEGAPLDFTFSGVKTHAVNLVHTLLQRGEALPIEDISAAFTMNVVDAVVERVGLALRQTGMKRLVCAGGVLANSHIRRALEGLCSQVGVELFIPPISLCGDNAAMIGAQAYHEYVAGNFAGADLNGEATMEP